MPTTCAPKPASIRTSAAVSYDGPRTAYIRASCELDTEVGSHLQSKALELDIVRRTHVRKALFSRVHRPRKRAPKRQVDLILDEEEVPRSELAVDSTGCIAHYEHLNAERRSDSNRSDDHLHGVSLIRVIPSRLQQNRCAVDVPGHERSAVSFDARWRKTRDFLEGHGRGVAHLRRKVAESRAEYHLDGGSEGEPATQEVSGGFHIDRSDRGLPAHRIIPATVAVMNAAIDPAIMARRPNRDRSCLREGAMPPMPPSWIAIEEKFANPESAYVAMTIERGCSWCSPPRSRNGFDQKRRFGLAHEDVAGRGQRLRTRRPSSSVA